MSDQKSIFVAMIGAPNAGKSTLVNALVGTKVSIVTPKVQTTRNRIMGIHNVQETQIVYIDTPGVFDPKKEFDEAMVHAALSAAEEADRVLFIVDARRVDEAENLALIEKLKMGKKPVDVVLNKVDLLTDKKPLFDAAKVMQEHFQDAEIFMISALKEKGLDDIVQHLTGVAPKAPWHFHDEDLTNLPLRLYAAEITREKVFLFLQNELPYGVYVMPETFEHREDGSIKIEQAILVSKENYKPMVLGKGGQMIKKIGQAARKDLMYQLECKVHLKLHVKVREKWMQDSFIYTEMGLKKG